jgi:hypothetical protein
MSAAGRVSTSPVAMARQCVAAFRPSLAGICGSVITRASTGGREEGTRTRESGGARCCASHGEPSCGRTPVRSRGGGNGNVPLTSTQLAQVRDGGGVGVLGRAMDGVWAATT